MIGWDFENVYVGNGPVSTWMLSSELASHGIRAIGWNEESGGVWVGDVNRTGGYSGGTGIFAVGDLNGYSAMVLVFSRPVRLEVDIAGSSLNAPSFSLAGYFGQQEVYAGSWVASDGPRPSTRLEVGEVTSVRLETRQSVIGVPIDAYREVPSPGAAAILLVAALVIKRRR